MSSRRWPRRKPNFHYLPTLSRAEPIAGAACAATFRNTWPASSRSAPLASACRCRSPRPTRHAAASELNFDIYAYICGLNFMVSGVRELLTGFGWHKKQIVFERYD